ncbi:MAG: class B sortase [Oscillospiraceae bacterium]|nr:class B sortase [Oscillospiraceae bacterium]
MSHKATPSVQRPGKAGGKFIPALCNFLGTLILMLVIISCLPLTVPRLLGYDIFNVVSGSMEPEIPVGSVVYVEQIAPEDVEPGDVIAFWRDDFVVTHRVVENRFVVGEFITKGDANEQEDLNPVPYNTLIGRVKLHLPLAGQLFTLLSGNVGKLYLLCLAACGVMFNILAGRIRANRRETVRAELEMTDEDQVIVEELLRGNMPRKRASPGKVIKRILLILALVVFLGSAGTILVVRHQYRVSDRLYESAAAQFITIPLPLSAESQTDPANQAAQDSSDAEVPAQQRLPEAAPIAVNFDGLREVNPDVVGWIFCPDTVINYPLLQGTDNDQYLHRSYNGEINASGSIFVEADNRRGFADSNTIIYGHHMNDNSMFATLDRWQDQDYYEEHPVIWLLTPEQDYKIELFSAYNTSAYSDTYTIFPAPSWNFTEYLKVSALYSTVRTGAEVDPNGHYVLLSTCAYVFDNARSVIHGRLVPVSSAGGVPFSNLD